MVPSNGGGISIPTSDIAMGNGGAEEQWAQQSPRRTSPPPRRSRSRSPGRGRDVDQRNANPGNNLHVSGLSSKVDNRELEAAFAKIGRVQKASVMYDPHSRESRGFGFVTMETGEEADAAVQAMNGTELSGKAITVEKARRARARTPTPGRYYGPPKRDDRPYDPRPYDSRYRGYDDRRGGYDRRGGGYDDRGPYGRDPRDYDRGYDRRFDDRGYDDRRPRYDDRRYDDRRY